MNEIMEYAEGGFLVGLGGFAIWVLYTVVITVKEYFPKIFNELRELNRTNTEMLRIALLHEKQISDVQLSVAEVRRLVTDCQHNCSEHNQKILLEIKQDIKKLLDR